MHNHHLNFIRIKTGFPPAKHKATYYNIKYHKWDVLHGLALLIANLKTIKNASKEYSWKVNETQNFK